MTAVFIDAIRRKLAEAAFFFHKLKAEQQEVIHREPEAFECYLSAFLSAARSVVWRIQTKEQAWFRRWREGLPADQANLLDFFKGQRDKEVHHEGAAVTHDIEPMSMLEYLAAASRQGHHVEISNGPIGNEPPKFSRPVRKFGDAEVTQECERCLAVLTNLVDALAEHFGA
jgi:hypothetical protein